MTIAPSVLDVRQRLMRDARHYADVAGQHGAGTLYGPPPIVNTAGAASLLAGAYSHILAALLGQMEKSGRPWTAEEVAAFVGELVANGDSDNLNQDVPVG